MDELQKLKDRLFMLEMVDYWENGDFETAQKLRKQIWDLEHPNEERKFQKGKKEMLVRIRTIEQTLENTFEFIDKL